jgi:hypothetical protein
MKIVTQISYDAIKLKKSRNSPAKHKCEHVWVKSNITLKCELIISTMDPNGVLFFGISFFMGRLKYSVIIVWKNK